MLGAGLLRKIKNAIPDRNEHVRDFLQFSESLLASSVLQWSEMVEYWEKDNTQLNPFAPTVKSECNASSCYPA